MAAPAPAHAAEASRQAPSWYRLPSAATKVLLVGLVLREAFTFWTGHPYDFEIWIRTGNAVAQGVNPYAFWPAIPGVSIAYPDISLPSAAYLPFWPLVTGALYRLWESIGGGDRFVLYFLLKQPPILGDLATAFLLYQVSMRWTGRASTATKALSFWSLFPYAIILSAIWGQFDSIVVALILAVFWVRGAMARNVLYGLGIFIKWVTAIFLPLEAFAERGWRRASFLIALAIPLFLTLAVFAGLGWGFQNVLAASVSQSHGGGGGMSWVGILTSGPLNPSFTSLPYLDTALGYLWAPAVGLAGWVGARWFASGEPKGMLRAMALVVGVFLLFRWGLYEQYMLYLFALVLLDLLVFHPGRRSLYYGTITLSLVYLLVNNDFGIRFLSPLSLSISSFTDALDASALYGTVRTYGLIVLCVLVTVTLVQVVLTFYRDERAPLPWWRFGRPVGPAGTPVATT